MTQRITTDADCGFLTFLSDGKETKIYPPLRMYRDKHFLFVDGKDSQQISISRTGFKVYIDDVLYTDLATAEGVLDVAVKCVNDKAAGGGGGGGGGDSSAVNQLTQIDRSDTQILRVDTQITKQDTQIAQADILNIGAVIDLTADDGAEWAGFPFTLDSGMAISFTINGTVYNFESSAVITKIEDLIEELGHVQTLLTFGKQDDTKLLVTDGTETVDSVSIITFESLSAALEYPKPGGSWSENAATPISVWHQIYNSLRGVFTYTRGIFNSVRKGTVSPHSVVSASITTVTLSAANPDRVKLVIVNNGTSLLYIKEGTGASLSDFTYPPRGQNKGVIIGDYTGIVTGIWVAANGDAQVTETT